MGNGYEIDKVVKKLYIYMILFLFCIYLCVFYFRKIIGRVYKEMSSSLGLWYFNWFFLFCFYVLSFCNGGRGEV